MPGLKAFVVLCAILTPLACRPSEGAQVENDADNRSEILAAASDWSNALVTGDIDRVVELYTEDAVLLFGTDEIRGRMAIRQFMTQDSTRHNLAHSATAEELSIFDSVAVELGTWRNTWRVSDGPEQTASGRYVVFWKRGGDGQWRMHYDMATAPIP